MTTAACDDLAIYRPPVARENEEKMGIQGEKKKKNRKKKKKSQPPLFELLLKFMYRRLTLGHF